MNRLYELDVNNVLIMPTFVLCHANQTPIDTISYVEEFHFKNQENNAWEINFSLRRITNGELNPLYEELEDFKLIYLPEWGKYYQIQVAEKDSAEGLVKNVTGIHLCEAELSQLMLYDIEINTENDALMDENSRTVIYNPDNPKQSLLHRILNDKGINYSVKYVSPSISGLTRSFSINGQSIDDFLRNTLSEELNCIVKYDSTDRTISLYDTLKICQNPDCKHRGDYMGDVCPKCGSTDIRVEYGYDTGIVIAANNLAQEINIETNKDEVKTCFRITGGDDMITASVRSVNPNGSQYIYNFSNEMLADMPEALRDKLVEYSELYAEEQPKYKGKMNEIYDKLDQVQLYEHSMMPDRDIPNTKAEKELNKLNPSKLGEIGIDSLSEKTSKTKVDNAVLSTARLQMSNGYNVKIVDSTFTYVSETESVWYGKFEVSHYGDEEDVAISSENIVLTVTNNYEAFVMRKINSELKAKDAYDVETDWELYSLSYLKSFLSAYESCRNVLTQLGIHELDDHGRLCKSLYEQYTAELEEIEAQIVLREKKLEELDAELATLENDRIEINKKLDFEKYLDVWTDFCSYKNDSRNVWDEKNEKIRSLIEVAEAYSGNKKHFVIKNEDGFDCAFDCPDTEVDCAFCPFLFGI